jgi:hypothetical protein
LLPWSIKLARRVRPHYDEANDRFTMTTLIQYVAVYAEWLYALCGLTALYQIYRLWIVRAERRQAVFSLERAKATQEIQGIFSIALLLLVTMGLTYFISTTLALAVEPLQPQVESANAVSEVILPTPTNTPAPTTPTPELAPTQSISQVVTLAPTATPAAAPPTPTPAPPPVAVQSANCPNPDANITSPGENAVLKGLSAVLGTANHPQFQYYKVEYAPAGTASWNYLGGGQNPVVNSGLLTFNSQNLPNGTWLLRLVVVDQTGNFPDPCQVTVQVQN